MGFFDFLNNLLMVVFAVFVIAVVYAFLTREENNK